jgi:hypothetical protein
LNGFGIFGLVPRVRRHEQGERTEG